ASEPALGDGCDVAFLALPHGASQGLVPDLIDRVPHVVDLAADFRLPADMYEQWYGHAHKAPELLDRFAFGLVELERPAIEAAQHVAVPGCYPTAASLALAPLLADGAVETTGIVVDALSGVSGAGRALKITSHFSEVNENASAYGLLTHRHTAEMELALTHVAGTDVRVLFTPHLVPMTRGILATCYARPAHEGLTTKALLDGYRDYYANDACVIVTDEPSGTRATYGANTAHVTVRADERTGTVLAIAAIDNMVKGAAGQAVQNTNILLGLPETTGLPLVGLAP
ncbi:MAG TPA: N-acetyl-gamma-glutamyl-phosphate reductase, partial [Acidimicrobiia bacterium]